MVAGAAGGFTDDAEVEMLVGGAGLCLPLVIKRY
jgi:hypothetical protein